MATKLLVGSNPVSFRDVTFASIEHPATLNIGAVEQKLTVAELPGGSKVVNRYGPQRSEVLFNGRLFDARVADLMDRLDSYVVDGQEGLLSWGSLRYYGIAHRLTPGYVHGYRATFELAITITREAVQNSPVAASADERASYHYTGAYTQLQALASTQTVTIPPIAYPQLNQSVTAIASSLATIGPLAQALPANLSALNGTIGTALAAASRYAPALGKIGSGVTAITRMIDSLTILKQIVGSAQVMDSQYLRGGSLFDICASRFGSIARVPEVMKLNGLASPILTSAVTQLIRFPK